MKIHESAEDYLERILVLKKQNGKVISIDIANSMNYSKPSISRAMKNLNACRIEHDLSDETFEAIKKHVLKAESI